MNVRVSAAVTGRVENDDVSKARLTFSGAGRLAAMGFPWGALMCALLLLSWPNTGSLAEQATSEGPLHARGIGRLTVGMTMEEARQLAGIQLAAEGPPPVPANYCTYFRVSLAGHEFRIRVIRNQVNRIEVVSPGVRTTTGIALGDSIERVKQGYGGNISVEPHHYLWDQGVVLMVGGPYAVEGVAYGIAFVASPARGVSEIWVGFYDEIRQSEGCV